MPTPASTLRLQCAAGVLAHVRRVPRDALTLSAMSISRPDRGSQTERPMAQNTRYPAISLRKGIDSCGGGQGARVILTKLELRADHPHIPPLQPPITLSCTRKLPVQVPGLVRLQRCARIRTSPAMCSARRLYASALRPPSPIPRLRAPAAPTPRRTPPQAEHSDAPRN
jgi:hypothetical protein